MFVVKVATYSRQNTVVFCIQVTKKRNVNFPHFLRKKEIFIHVKILGPNQLWRTLLHIGVNNNRLLVETDTLKSWKLNIFN
jgi:hypothetical protein